VHAIFHLLLLPFSLHYPAATRLKAIGCATSELRRVPREPEKRTASTPDDIIDRYLDIASRLYLHLLLLS